MAEEPNVVVVTCACGQRMKVPEAAAGKVYKCVKCGEPLSVPGAAPAASPNPPKADAPGAGREPIGELLIEHGLITRAQLESALAEQRANGGKVLEVLLRLGHLDRDTLHQFLSRQPGVAAIDLSRFSIDRNLIRMIPRELALKQMLLPIDRLGKLLTVAMACPLDLATIAEMERHTQLKVKAVLCRLDDLEKAIAKYYPDTADEGGMHVFVLPPGVGEAPKEDLAGRIQALEALAVSKETLSSLITALQAGEGAMEKALDVAAADPALAAQVLRLANQPMYGLVREVDSLGMAVVLLGVEGLQGLLLALQALKSPPGVLPPVLQPDARKTAELAAALAKLSGQTGSNEAYAAGLLHELGRLAYAQVSPEKARRLPWDKHGPEAAELERHVFTQDHAQLGGALAAQWRYPEALTTALRQHLAAPPEAGPLGQILHAAVILASASIPDAPAVLENIKSSLTAAGIKPEAAMKAAREIR